MRPVVGDHLVGLIFSPWRPASKAGETREVQGGDYGREDTSSADRSRRCGESGTAVLPDFGQKGPGDRVPIWTAARAGGGGGFPRDRVRPRGLGPRARGRP